MDTVCIKLRKLFAVLGLKILEYQLATNAGAEEVGHALCAAKVFSLNLQFLHITSSSVIYQYWLSEHTTNYQWRTIGS